MIQRFDKFTDDELYILKRQSIESSCNIVMSGDYNEHEIEIHGVLINEIIDNIKEREKEKTTQ